VTGFRDGQGGLIVSRSRIADEHDVRVLARHVLQGGRERGVSLPTSRWFTSFGAGRGIRGVLDGDDVDIRSRLMRSSMAAIDVVFPCPVGPVTRMRPLCRWISWVQISAGSPAPGSSWLVGNRGDRHADHAALPVDVDTVAERPTTPYEKSSSWFDRTPASR
jgi:hypothetical protein